MGQIVYLLCALTCLGCTWLLIARYRKTRVDLLFWSALAFLLFLATNILLYVDLVVLGPQADLVLYRNGSTLVGVMVLLYGLIRNN
ncbi:MAG TPA: DUF5985 family protein [Candidatus Kapabacteria bacterium]|nr:DUF5985 family protein [Candidatus Kapabacteria bacterium]